MPAQVIYFSLKLPPSYFLKINFDAVYMIEMLLGDNFLSSKSANGALVVASNVKMFDTIVSMAKLNATWQGLTYAI